MFRDGHIYFFLGSWQHYIATFLGLHHRQRLLGGDMNISKETYIECEGVQEGKLPNARPA